MRILLLGATGYLGAHTARRLRALPGAQLVTGGRAAGAGLRIDLATADPADLGAALRRLRPDTVVNCAGAVGGGAVRLTGLNARGPAVLCAALREAAPHARLVHLGSAAEYGACPRGTSLDESAAVRPVGLYGATKLAGTLAVADSPLDAVVLRVFNPVGPGAPADSLPGRLVDELRRVGSHGVVRVGDLSAHRDFVDVRDIARAVALAAVHPTALPRVLNIAGGAARPVREVATGLAAVAGFRGRIDEGGAGSERSAAVSWQQADIGAAARALGWRPGIPLADSLADLWSGRPVAESAA
ncbi:NAD-dependent epimerase/dehydratase family protein [Peterkaempfera bronchialis]|uniref:NAD(P)-dependent oxidoreductase n=1 Tax=Peterkaempfera bronchialis TaxID=2126346 RepID=A0A345SW77_9ACTN|nr:NAD(P)-dependent oxidoreductase [Peterkaempfera bronchialis]AXI77982.1 NAD(P)-dependent oxidoreductase [Peterkaempfera bronchialis]